MKKNGNGKLIIKNISFFVLLLLLLLLVRFMKSRFILITSHIHHKDSKLNFFLFREFLYT